MIESPDTYPYPLRPSEVVTKKEFYDKVDQIPLTKDERKDLKLLDQEIFSSLQPLRELEIKEHTIYPAAFLDDQGKKLFISTFLNTETFQSVGEMAEDGGINMESVSEAGRVFDAFMDDLIRITSSERDYLKYLTEGTEFSKLSAILGREEQIVFRGGNLGININSVDVIKNIFWNEDLTKLPRRVRERLEIYSSEWTEIAFKKSFLENKGDLNKIENPERVGRIVNPDDLLKKMTGLTELKTRIKDMTTKLGNCNSDRAKRIVYDLYRKRINVSIADHYPLVRLILDNPQPTEDENRIIKEIYKYSESKTPETISRTVEKIDHFLKGVGEGISIKGLFESVPQRLNDYSRQRELESLPEETEISQKYNSIKLGSEQMKQLCDYILREYRLDQGEKPWISAVLDKEGGMAVAYSNTEDIREVRIPKTLKSGLIKAMGLIAHEIEGHVLRYANKETALKDTLKIVETSSTGRSEVFSEGAAMSIETSTIRGISGVEKHAIPYYFIALREKRNGGSFKECLKSVLEDKVKRENNLTLDEAVEMPDVFDAAFDSAFSRTLRIFRNHTPLNDATGYVTASDQLVYIEQEPVVESLFQEKSKEMGLDKLLYVAGLDLYSIREILKLGVVDLTKVKEPEMVVLNKIWPVLKEGLDQGLSLQETLNKLTQ